MVFAQRVLHQLRTFDKVKLKLYFLIIIAVILTLGAYAIYLAAMSPLPGTAVSPAECTMEAKRCPDGTYVGRTGPNCAFARCPGA